MPEHAVTGSAALQLGPARLFGEVRYESEIALQVGSRRSASRPRRRSTRASRFVPAQIPYLEFFPERLSLSVEGLNLTGEQRFDSLGLPLPEDPLWLVRLRGATP